MAYIYTSVPLYYPGTDVQVAELDIRIHPKGDDQRLWDIQFAGLDDNWHAVPAQEHHLALAYVEKYYPGTWGEIMRAA